MTQTLLSPVKRQACTCHSSPCSCCPPETHNTRINNLQKLFRNYLYFRKCTIQNFLHIFHKAQ
jgi:hypothetical protein